MKGLNAFEGSEWKYPGDTFGEKMTLMLGWIRMCEVGKMGMPWAEYLYAPSHHQPKDLPHWGGVTLWYHQEILILEALFLRTTLEN